MTGSVEIVRCIGEAGADACKGVLCYTAVGVEWRWVAFSILNWYTLHALQWMDWEDPFIDLAW